MRIISRYKDYYDSASAWRDEKLCYVREETEPVIFATGDNRHYGGRELVTSEEFESMSLACRMINDMPRCNWAELVVVAFCGMLYPCYRTDEGDTFYDVTSMERSFKKSHELEKLKHPKYRSNADYEGRLDVIKKRTIPRRSMFSMYTDNLNHGSWMAFLSNNMKRKTTSDSFRAVKSPVYTLSRSRYHEHIMLTVNPSLKNLSFAKKVDPYTAFQEISMYLGNDLVDQMNPDIERSDDLIRHQKGFDKWSFRKVGKKGMK